MLGDNITYLVRTKLDVSGINREGLCDGFNRR